MYTDITQFEPFNVYYQSLAHVTAVLNLQNIGKSVFPLFLQLISCLLILLLSRPHCTFWHFSLPLILHRIDVQENGQKCCHYYSSASAPPLQLQRWKRGLLSRPCPTLSSSTSLGSRWTWGEALFWFAWYSFIGFNACLFLMLHSQQSKRRYFLVQGPPVPNLSIHITKLLYSEEKQVSSHAKQSSKVVVRHGIIIVTIIVKLKVRSDNPDIWLWLGDNAYNDGTDMDFKRRKWVLRN